VVRKLFADALGKHGMKPKMEEAYENEKEELEKMAKSA
jgi:hypothetical protein